MDCVESHLLTRLYCMKAAIDQMVGRGGGKIILVTTDAGRTPTPGESLIGGAAAAVVFMTRAVAQEVVRSQIRINTICTTVTRDTPGWDKAMSDESTHLFKLFNKAEARIPLGINKPDDIAQLALYLASDDSNQITGQVFSVNGGLSFPG
ncbi:MAG: SDR family oxidoreductase [Chloroflexi bacterium]|nr:SDR family oxidoreductase [Chloroflexota bacterium]